MTPVITVTDAPSDEAKSVIESGLARYNSEQVGYGDSRSLAEAEAEAKRRGCRAVVLYTISFQAPGFYEKLGYRRSARSPAIRPERAGSSS